MKRIDHLNRYVSNVDKFIDFYRGVFGYELIDRGIKENGKDYAILKGDGHEKDPDGFEIDFIEWTDKEKFYQDLKAKNNEYIFESPRLGFRMWKESDKEIFYKMNASKEVMRYFPKTLEPKESDGFLYKVQEHFKRYGYGLWAVEVKDTKEFIRSKEFNMEAR